MGRAWLCIVCAALALALELPNVDRQRRGSYIEIHGGQEGSTNLARRTDGVLAEEKAGSGEQATRGHTDTDAVTVTAEAKTDKGAKDKTEAGKDQAGAKKHPGDPPFEVFANSAAGRKGDEPQSLNVILGPNGLEQQLAEQEAEEREEKEQANRPYWLQVFHDMLAPLRLPVIRGHPPALLQAGGRKDHPRWRFLPATSFTHLPKTMAQRLSVQDMAVLLAVVIFYLSTIMIALSLVYHSSSVSSGVKWFCEPELYTCASKSYFDFMATFNRPPETRVRVLITNRIGTRKRLDLLLDVTPLCGDGPHAAHIEPSDEKTIRDFIANTSTLATLLIQKNVVWEGFDELRERIQKRVQEQGFEGKVSVSLERSRDLVVRRNTQMFHFVHSQITLILVLMSIAGLFVFWPLVWLRRRTWYASTTFTIDATPEDYMQLVDQALPDACTHAEDSDAPTTAGSRGSAAGHSSGSDSGSREGRSRRTRWPRSQMPAEGQEASASD